MNFVLSDYKWTERLFKKNAKRARKLLKALEKVIDEEDYEKMKKYYARYIYHAYRAMESYSETQFEFKKSSATFSVHFAVNASKYAARHRRYIIKEMADYHFYKDLEAASTNGMSVFL